MIAIIVLGMSTPNSTAAGIINGAVAVNWAPADGTKRLIKLVTRNVIIGNVTSFPKLTKNIRTFCI